MRSTSIVLDAPARTAGEQGEKKAVMPLRVLTGSSDPSVAKILDEGLARRDYELLPSCPFQKVVEAVGDGCPDVLVLDIEGQGSIQAKELVRILRKISPALRIVVLSAISAFEDGEVIEEGVFYYMTKPAGGMLVEIVEAAGRAVLRKRLEG